MIRRRLIVVILPLIALLLALATSGNTASAHAIVLSTDPSDGATVTTAPKQIIVRFSEPIVLRLSTVEIVDGNGRHLPIRSLHSAPGQPLPDRPRVIVVGLPRLQSNVYRVSWHVLSDADLHVSTGVMVFGIGQTVQSNPGPIPTASPGTGDVLLRWLNFAALAGMLGAIAMVLLILPRTTDALLQAHGPRSPTHLVYQVRWRLQFMVLWCSLLALVVGVGLLALAASDASWWQIVIWTGYGKRWLVRQALLLAGTLILLPTLRKAPAPGLRPLAWPDQDMQVWTLLAMVPIALGLVLVQALNSHAAGLADGAPVAVAADALHVLAAGMWIGGLFAVLLVFPLLRRTSNSSSLSRAIFRRFGMLAAISLATLVVTGIYAVGLQVVSLDALLQSFYGHSLLLKIALGLVAAMIGLHNAALFHPRVALALQAATRGRLTVERLRIRRALMLEAMFAACVLLLAAVLSAAQPARGPQYEPPAAAPTAPASVTATAADLVMTLSVKPNRPGRAFVVLGIYTARRPAPGAIYRVSLQLRGPGARPSLNLIALPQRGGNYQVVTSAINAAGTWRIAVAVHRVGLAVTTLTVPWTVLPNTRLYVTHRVLVSDQPLKPILTRLSLIGTLLLFALLVVVAVRRQTMRRRVPVSEDLPEPRLRLLRKG
jgi:copper transport protein